MGEQIRHECGVAMVRLLKPLSYYYEKYDTPLWGFQKLFLLMEKQHNRGQDGSGIGALKLNVKPGFPFMFRERSIEPNSLDTIFNKLLKDYSDMERKGIIHPEFATTVKENFDFGAEVYLGHLRYGTSGGYNIRSCHPYFRRSNWATKNVMLAGNFTITNNQALNAHLIHNGQHPIFETDTQTLLEGIGFHLDRQHDQLYHKLKDEGHEGPELVDLIERQLDLAKVIREASTCWDGGYAIAGLIGNGDVFALRDPNGIRPLYYFQNDDVIAFASERAPLMTVFDLEIEQTHEVPPGSITFVKKNGTLISEQVTEPGPQKACSFERIYFSRGSDFDIYQERKRLGSFLADQILEEIDHDFDHSVISYVPNTAETAYFGLLETLRLRRRMEVKKLILEAHQKGELTEEFFDSLILHGWPRTEKVVHKDIKLRTFISQESGRNQLASHVYDISYGSINPNDTLVCLDDSVVRGTTLKRSVIKILSRLNPKKIIIASTAPQIRYPDCYGIDMSQLGKFIAFQAVIELLRERGQEFVIKEVYQQSLQQADKPDTEMVNLVKKLYDRFTPEEVSLKISQLVTPNNGHWKGQVVLIFQTIENLHKALPNHSGDWYFTGNYPTPGGYRVLNQAFINFYQDSDLRSY